MRLRFRIWIIFLAALLRRKNLRITEDAKITLTVMPWDCVLRYVGNDRYHAFLDLARMDLAIRLGWLKIMLPNRWHPQVISCHVRHRHPLHIFDRFVICTYIAEINSKHIWMGHRIERNGVVVSTAVSKMVAVSQTGIADLLELLQLLSGNHHKSFNRERLIVFEQVESILRGI